MASDAVETFSLDWCLWLFGQQKERVSHPLCFDFVSMLKRARQQMYVSVSWVVYSFSGTEALPFPRQDLLCREETSVTVLLCRQDAEHDLYCKGETPRQI